MVLIRRSILMALCALVGCSESLFDAHDPVGSGSGSGPGSGPGTSTCPGPCLADAAADFDGTPGGAGGRWRYLDDHRDRTWTAMTPSATAMAGADPGNHITTCAAKPGAPACAGLPGALLVSSAGAASAADPAVEYTAKTNQVVQLGVHALAPSGDDQQIRIYRNSREDVLYTATAIAGTAFDKVVTLDALAGDRFLVAVATTGAASTDVGLQVFVTATTTNFPSTCQVAVPFAAASGNTVDNVCGGDFTHKLYTSDTATPPTLGAGPYAELGMAADIAPDSYFLGTGTLDKTHDTTVQFWMKLRKLDADGDAAWAFSDLDLDVTGGLGVAIVPGPPVVMDVTTCTEVTMTTLNFADATTPYPTDGSWQFVRIVHTGGVVHICLNGAFATSFNVPAGKLQSTFSPYFGRNVIWTPAGAFFDGEIDDLRVLTDALPCN